MPKFDDSDTEYLDRFTFEMLEGFRVGFISGQMQDIFEAIIFCGEFGQVLPKWVYNNISVFYRRYADFECKTLDEAFFLKPRSHVNRSKELSGFLPAKIAFYVEEERKKGVGLGIPLYETVAAIVGVNRKKVEQYYKFVVSGKYYRRTYTRNRIYKP